MPIKINGTNTAANPSITGDDTDTGIVYGSDQIDFSIGGSSKVFLNSSGNQLFTGNAVISVDSNSSNLYLGGGSNQPSEAYLESGTFSAFKVNGSERMRINSDGRVGIGASDPSTGQLVVYRQTVNSGNPIIQARSNHDTTNSIKFEIDGDGDAFFSDNVGIGTTSPAHKVHIKDSSANPLLMVERDSGATSVMEAQTDKGVFGTGNNHPVYFLQNSGTAMVIDTSRRVGIGTLSPDTKLTVATSSGDAFIRATGGTNQGLLLNKSDGTLIGAFASGGTLGGGVSDIGLRAESGNNILFSHGTTERMRIASGGAVTFNSTGDVGSAHPGVRIQNPDVGTCRFAVTTSSTKTHIQFLNNNANNVRGSIVTDGSSTAYNQSSDYRLKENETAISDGISRIKLLKPYRFNWKEDNTKIVDGFFAHEVSSIVPEAITGEKDAIAVQADVDSGVSDKVGDPIYQQIDQSKLVPLLVAGLQEEIAKREALETENAKLQTDLTSLTARVAALEAA